MKVFLDRAPGPAAHWVQRVRRRASLDGSLSVFASIDGEPAGAFLLEDVIRPGLRIQ